ncbi:hypothetical protein GXU17_001710 [Escherichia coli]|nr:hypothetical protein [Escherichia coli]EFI4245386.1 hypothetical protein [Escherichia coli]EFI5848661.1 hypothetical protein [Escherichia coli]EFJ0049922.1 hypothetical protein [Escherichia coli]
MLITLTNETQTKSGHNPLRRISFSRKQQNKHCTVYSFQRVNTRSNVARN